MRSLCISFQDTLNLLFLLSFEDLLEAEAPLILPEADERVQVLKRVCDRLVAAMEAEGFVCAAIWPRDSTYRMAVPSPLLI